MKDLNENDDFEKAMQKLELIVEKLESGEVSLAKSLELFEEGVILSKFCQKELDIAEAKVALLLKKSEDRFELLEFNIT